MKNILIIGCGLLGSSLLRQIQKKKISTIRIISRSANHNMKQSIRNGGLFMDKGIHFFDLACWLSSSKPKKILSIAEPLSSIEYLKNNDFSDAFVVIKFDSCPPLCV